MAGGLALRALGTRFALVLFLTIALSACAVQFVSGYDEVFDRSASETQRSIALLLNELQDPASPTRNYRSSATRYAEIAADLHALRARAEAHDEGGRNAETLTILGTIEDNIALVEERHKRSPSGLSVAFVQSAQGLIDLQFRSLIQLELAKKRGL